MELLSERTVMVGAVKEGGLRNSVREGECPHYRTLTGFDPEKGDSFEYDLSPKVNGECPQVGERVVIHLKAWRRRAKLTSRKGVDYEATLYNLEVIGFGDAA
jgi:hypothetical protein